MDERNLSLVMDLYELTMSNGYFLNGKEKQMAVFDVFYRNNPDDAAYSIFCGLDHVIKYIQNLHFDEDDIEYLKSLHIFDDRFLEYLRNFSFKGDIYAFKEGTIIYPNEPVITVVAPLIDCQLIETAILLLVNHESLIATKANRIVLAAKGRPVSDFGARRAHNADSAVYGARAAYIGGCVGTATVLAGKMFDIPVTGTMAHSWVMSFESEYDAFLEYAKLYRDNCSFLVDTYDVLNSGILNAIKVQKDYLDPNGYRLKSIRIDSGDLAYLSKKCRKILNENGMDYVKIIASNSLDENKIGSLISQGACLDIFGVGENMITSKSCPVFGFVYKLAAIQEHGLMTPKIKLSETVEKITNPGFKDVYRVYNKDGQSVADLLACVGEDVSNLDTLKIVDPSKPWKQISFESFTLKKLQCKIFEKGKLIYKSPSAKELREYVRKQIECELWDEEKRFVMPHIHYLDFTKNYYDLKMKLISYNKYEK